MKKLLKRLNADSEDHFGAMLMYSAFFNLPYVAEDLVDAMEFWANDDTFEVSVVLHTADIEVHELKIEWGSAFLYPELVAMLT